MSSLRGAARYRPASILLHWFMFIVIAVAYAAIEGRGQFPRGTIERDALKALHYSFGILVFALVWARIGFRLTGRTAPVDPPLNQLLKLTAWVLKAALYAFMIVMPVLGWAALSAKGGSIAFFGIGLPPLIPEDHGLAERLEDIHEQIGNAGYYLIGLHIAAGLYHHFVRRDNAVTGILP